MKSILLLFHVESNTGYAIAPLEALFFRMALALCGGDSSRIHVAYPSMARGPSPTLPANFDRYVILDSKHADGEALALACEYIRRHGIDTVFGFDQRVSSPVYRHLRRAGVKHFISYWGAPMSSINSGLRRLLKRLEVALYRHGPDHYIFESHGMAETATLGRGISPARTSVVYLGTDPTRFRPDAADAQYVYEHFAIPSGRRIFFYSGHMEPRKGVAVIMGAANRLAGQRTSDDWHIVLFGNKREEDAPYLAMLGPRAREHVTFGGYRSDLPVIQRGCYAGVIASTGWDSLTMSSMEMQASGLPLILSDLRGLREAIQDGVTGILFPAGDETALAGAMSRLLDDPQLRDRLGRQARQRIESGFTSDIQVENLVRLVRRLTG